MGEAKRKAKALANTTVALDTFGGRVHVEWGPQAAMNQPFWVTGLR